MGDQNLPVDYVSSDGKVTPIVEMNNFHLVNSLVKKLIEFEDKGMIAALKGEVLRRLDPAKPPTPIEPQG